MKPIYYFLIFTSLLYVFTISSSDTLDISDFTYYYKTQHYLIDESLPHATFYNPQTQTNISIDFDKTNQKALLTLHDSHDSVIELDILNDNNWDEISTIKPIQKQQQKNTQSLPKSSHRSLLQYGGPPPPHGPPLQKVYKGFRKPASWNDAKAGCRAFGALLASVRTPQQNMNAMKTCTQMAHNMICWIGLKRPFTTWADSKSVEFSNWRKGEPNNQGGNQDCAEIYPNGLWNDEDCEKGRAYICQKIQPGLPSSVAPQPPPKPGAPGGCGSAGSHGAYGSGPGGGKCGQSGPCGSSPCRRARRKRRVRRHARRRAHRARRKRKRIKTKWRTRMKRLRRMKDAKLKRALARLKRRHRREAQTYSWIANLLDTKLEHMKSTGDIKAFGEGRRRLLGSDMVFGEIVYVDKVRRCRYMGGYEICVNYYYGSKFMSLDVRFVERKVVRDGDSVSYRQVLGEMKDLFVDGMNTIERHLGHVIGKYEVMDWHSFEGSDSGGYEYGEFEGSNGFIHYFDEFQLEWDSGMSVECSELYVIHDLPFRMCMKGVVSESGEVGVSLYFEKDSEDGYEIGETYSFRVKEFIDYGFENNVFVFGEDSGWDEIDSVYLEGSDMQWSRKCSYKLMIAKVCIEQFDMEHYTATIKLKSENGKPNE